VQEEIVGEFFEIRAESMKRRPARRIREKSLAIPEGWGENRVATSTWSPTWTAHQKGLEGRIGVDAFAEVDMFSPVGSPAG
jgi:hypothetical protein